MSTTTGTKSSGEGLDTYETIITDLRLLSRQLPPSATPDIITRAVLWSHPDRPGSSKARHEWSPWDRCTRSKMHLILVYPLYTSQYIQAGGNTGMPLSLGSERTLDSILHVLIGRRS